MDARKTLEPCAVFPGGDIARVRSDDEICVREQRIGRAPEFSNPFLHCERLARSDCGGRAEVGDDRGGRIEAATTAKFLAARRRSEGPELVEAPCPNHAYAIVGD